MCRSSTPVSKQNDIALSRKNSSLTWRLIRFVVLSTILGSGSIIFSLWYVVTYPNEAIIDYIDSVLDEYQEYKKHLEEHIYLNKTYEPVADEHHTPVMATVVEGMIPTDLHGIFMQIGPNPIPSHLGKKRYHWFDGHGLLHNVYICGGQDCGKNSDNKQISYYTNSFIPTPRYNIEKFIKNKEYFLKFGEVKGIAGLLKIFLDSSKRKLYSLNKLYTGQANTHTILTKENKLYALHEASLPYEIELDQDGVLVRGLGYETFDNTLNYPISAHPKIDSRTGNLLFHSYSADESFVARDGNFKVGEYSAAKSTVQTYYGIRTVDNHTSFGHDMMFTKHWFVIYDNSVHFDGKQVLNDTGNIFTWNPSSTLKIGLAPRYPSSGRNSADVIWFDVGTPHVTIHPLNAWEEDDGDTVVMWSPVGNSFEIDLTNGTNCYHMTEFRMKLSTKQITMKIIDDQYSVEFSRVRDDYYGEYIRYGTTGILDIKLGGDGLFGGFVLFDMLRKNVAGTYVYRHGDIGGEPIVIAKPNTKYDFYVGTYLNNVIDAKSYIQLFDIDTSNENNVMIRNITRIELPYRVPTGFHCNWISHKQLMDHVHHHEQRRKESVGNYYNQTKTAYEIIRSNISLHDSNNNHHHKLSIDEL